MYTSVTHYALLYSLLPTITALLSMYRGKDRATTATGCGILLSWTGCTLAVSDGTDIQEIGFGFGDALVLLFTLMMSGYFVLSPNVVKQFGVWTSNTTMFGTSALLLLAGTAAGGMAPQETDLSVEVAVLLLFIGMATAGVFLLRSRALQSLTPATVGAYHNLIPICTIGLAHFILGETVTTYTLLGGTAVVGGTELIRRASFLPHPRARVRADLASSIPHILVPAGQVAPTDKGAQPPLPRLIPIRSSVRPDGAPGKLFHLSVVIESCRSPRFLSPIRPRLVHIVHPGCSSSGADIVISARTLDVSTLPFFAPGISRIGGGSGIIALSQAA